MSEQVALERTVTIVNRRGLHARAAAKLTKLAAHFHADITVQRNAARVPARSLMGLLTLGASQGKDVTLMAVGEDAQEALDQLCALIERGFDEDDSDGS